MPRRRQFQAIGALACVDALSSALAGPSAFSARSAQARATTVPGTNGRIAFKRYLDSGPTDESDLNHRPRNQSRKEKAMSLYWHAFTPFVRRILVCVLLAGLGLVIFAGTALAQATRGDFSFQQTVTFTDVSSCTGLTGTGVNTATTVGQFVDTGQTFHVHGTTVQVYRIDWSDGTYLLSRSPSHFEFNTNSVGQFVSTEVQQDPGILYGPDGQVIGRITVFTLSHMTWRDTNGNGQPDLGEVTASVDQFRVSCR